MSRDELLPKIQLFETHDFILPEKPRGLNLIPGFRCKKVQRHPTLDDALQQSILQKLKSYRSSWQNLDAKMWFKLHQV
jgi:hypothetical protein